MILKVLIGVLYAAFVGIDIYSFNSELTISHILKVSGIIICVVSACLIRENCHDKKDRTILQIALLLTLVGDVLLGIFHQFLFGLGTFALVHIVYSVRHFRGFRSIRAEMLLAGVVYAFGALVMTLSAPVMKSANLFIPSLVYAVPLATSLYAGIGTLIRGFYPRRVSLQIAIGVPLFFAADVAVAHFNARSESDLRTIIGIFVWIVYMPAQLLLTLSGTRRN